jgi:hypothetical protein
MAISREEEPEYDRDEELARQHLVEAVGQWIRDLRRSRMSAGDAVAILIRSPEAAPAAPGRHAGPDPLETIRRPDGGNLTSRDRAFIMLAVLSHEHGDVRRPPDDLVCKLERQVATHAEVKPWHVGLAFALGRWR